MQTTDPTFLAADARSILARPATVSLVVEGEPHAVDEETGLADQGGTPTFVCRPDSPVARASGAHRSAILTVTSGLGRPGCPERADALTLAGRLERTGHEHCDCCGEVRLAEVTPYGVELHWVDAAGAHQRDVWFPRVARDLGELGELLRRSLHSLAG